ncbi:glycosyl transferase [Thecamonas trahens ATCC 50062]|uniref:Glycosyl transferase n=1 Tax=Thecamonas trahens ATCC 50062 TaxID=461836 RepID=A0A0L0D9R4_THETB|nr:glycosyl transferase [Thecamonas trahens ATCC 50062]KNC48995.1 glycosyl transferase [Thecamonas trahens ATCC 50062]|eukprot:XP_013758408.1 glycosyl transferase [Thecamonas trahens ATCC 50062]
MPATTAAVLLVLLLVAAPAVTEARFAFVVLHYEGTPADDAYVLGTQVTIATVLEQHPDPAIDVVVLAVHGVRPEVKARFAATDPRRVVVREVPDIGNPFGHAKPRFRKSLNKLHAWALVDYERVVFLDSDTVALHDMSALFRCGHFCVVYLNPTRFHTALMVIKPDVTVFSDMRAALRRSPSDPNAPASHDGADQGFLNWYFAHARAGPLFDVYLGGPDGGERFEHPAMRLTIAHAMHHIYFYEHGTWDGYRVAGAHPEVIAADPPALSISFPGPTWTKPWDWRGYLFFVGNWLWADARARLPSDLVSPPQIASAALAYVVIPAALTGVFYALAPAHGGTGLSPASGRGLVLAGTAVTATTYGVYVAAELVSPFAHPYAGFAIVLSTEMVAQHAIRLVGVWMLTGHPPRAVRSPLWPTVLALAARLAVIGIGACLFHFVLKVLLLGAGILASLALSIASWGVVRVSSAPEARPRCDAASPRPWGSFPAFLTGFAVFCVGSLVNVTGMSVAELAVDLARPPLVDVVHARWPDAQTGAIGEVLLLAAIVTPVFVGVVYNRFADGFTILGRVFASVGAVYVVRGVAVGVTDIPVPNNHCRAWDGWRSDDDTHWSNIAVGLRTLGTDPHCGDLILSGHTIVVVVATAVMVSYYARLVPTTTLASCALALVASASFVLSHNHYTVDVWLAAVVTTLVWHSLPAVWPWPVGGMFPSCS